MLIFLLLCSTYVVCGSLYSVVYSSTVYHGAAQPQSLIALLPGYVGMVLAAEVMKIVLPSGKDMKEKREENAFLKENSAKFWKLSALHYFASILIGAAISAAGSSLFQVCYSAGPIFAAGLQYTILGKTISIYQALCILLIVSGLASLVLLKPDTPDSNNGSGGFGPETMIGILLTFATSFSYNLCNTISQSILQGNVKVSPANYLYAVGSRCVKLELFALLVWTAPRWEDLVIAPLNAAGTSNAVWFAHQIALLVCCAGINFSYYWVVSNSSVVLLSVLAGFNTVGALLLSDFFFCDEQRQHQCMTYHKAKCSSVIVLAIACYGAASALKSKSKEKENVDNYYARSNPEF